MRGQHVVLYGLVEMRGSVSLQITNPQYEILDDEDGETIHTGRIVPVYEKTGTVTPKMQRRLVLRRAAEAAGRAAGSAARGRAPAAGAAVALRRADGDAFSAVGRVGRGAERVRDAGAAPADLRGGVHLPDGRARAPADGGGGAEAAGGPRRRSHPRLGARGAAVPADERAEAGAEGDRRRPAEAAADEPAAAGRRRRGEDDRRAAGGAGGDGERPAGRVHGADRDPRRAAFHQHLAAAAGVALPRRAADRIDGQRGASRAARGGRIGRDPPRRRHARAGAGRRRVQAARPGGDRRAAPVRRAAAGDAARQGAASRRAGDDRDADPAHAGADGLRRSRRVDDPRAAGGAAADQDDGAKPESRRDEIYQFVREQLDAGRQVVRDLPAGRGVGEDRSEGGDRDGRSPRRPRCSRPTRSACCTAG